MKKISMALPFLAFALFIGASAFTFVPLKTYRTTSVEQWHLKANMTINDATNPGAYEPVSGTPSCDEGNNLPCIIAVDLAQFDDLADYLSQFSTGQQVTAAAVSTRTN